MDIKSNGTHVDLYSYHPSNGAAITFVTLFGIGTVAHMFLMFFYGAYFFIPFIIGSICETFGYYGRVWASQNPNSVKAYVLQSLLILAAPPFLAATIYMTLGRTIRALNADHLAPISPRWLTTLFVLSDVVCLATQLLGAGMQVTTSADVQRIGGIVILGGLIFQIVCFAFFILAAGRFHARINHTPTSLWSNPRLKWSRQLFVLYVASGAVLLRNLVRVIEYAQGRDGAIMAHEAYLYVFDASLMLLVVVLYLFHPGRVLSGSRAERFKGANEGII